MIERVLNLNQRSVSSIMTSRHDIEHIDLNAPDAQVRALLDKNQHTRIVVTGGEEEEDSARCSTCDSLAATIAAR